MDEQQKKMAEELLFAEKKAPSFAKKLFFGTFDSSYIYPFPFLPAHEQHLLDQYQSKVREFVDKELDPSWIDSHAEIPNKVIKGLGDLGVLGMTVPKEFGGLNMPQRSYCRIVEMIAGKCSSTALLINAHQSIGLKALILFGKDNQRKQWLESLARGEKIAAFALTEPNAGSDASGVESKAVFDPVKNIYRINGTKQWITNGSVAGVLTVMAKTSVDTPNGKQDKITAFLVTPNMPGFKVKEAGLEKVGMRGTKTAILEFHDMEVPAENILGPIGGGLKVCLTVLDYGRTTFGAMCTGAAKFLMEKAIDHSKNRHQFGKPLASFGLVQKKIANMAALTFAIDASTQLTAGLIDAGVEDIMLESAILKVFASEALWQILYDTMQIFGGRSFFPDYPLERMMRDARLNMIGEGSNEVMRAFIGAVGMRDVGMELKGAAETMKHPIKERHHVGALISTMMDRMQSPKMPFKSKELHEESKKLSRLIKRFGFKIIQLLARYREKIVDEQLELERVADAVIALYTATAVISKLDTMLSSSQQFSSMKEDLAAGKLYCRHAFNTIENNLNQLFANTDEEIISLAEQLTGISS